MSNPKIIGQPINRVDGRQKVTGRASYAADSIHERTVHAAPVMSTIAAGEIVRLTTDAAERAPGVLAVLHHGNIPKLQRCPDDSRRGLMASEIRTPFEDQKIYYAGQFVAVVVAETLEQARWAARLVEVEYRATPHALTLDEGIKANRARPQEDEATSRGDATKAFAGAAVQVDATYTTPVEVHSAMELHSSVARWEGDHLIVDDSTQWVFGQSRSLAHILGVPEDKVTVRSPFIGGGFGSKLFIWPHTVLAAVAAQIVGRPVKLVLPRQWHFTSAGHRPLTRQRVRLGATESGRLVAIRHDAESHTSLVHDYVESCTETTAALYSCPHVATSHHLIAVNTGTPTSMRAPGSCPGLFALESALDELAEKLRLDPIELRRRNLPARDENRNLPWSSCHFDDCLRTVADRFGWSRREAKPGSMREGGETIGWGFAAASWPAHRQPAEVRVEFWADGTAKVSCATQDIGTGTYTVFAQVVSELTGLPVDQIEVRLGDSSLPRGPISGGSMATASVLPAITNATRAALVELFQVATQKGGVFPGEKPAKLALSAEGVSANGKVRSLADVLRAGGRDHVGALGQAKPGEERRKFSFRSFGAHCVEVRWDAAISRLRVTRVVSAFDVGRIINCKTATNQIEGGIVMGLGMALLEESIYDQASGRVVTDNLADYHLPVNADIPVVDVTLLDRPDPEMGEFGARGLGEIGTTGIAAAIANAVYHATGKRIRDLPIAIEKLMA